MEAGSRRTGQGKRARPVSRGGVVACSAKLHTRGRRAGWSKKAPGAAWRRVVAVELRGAVPHQNPAKKSRFGQPLAHGLEIAAWRVKSDGVKRGHCARGESSSANVAQLGLAAPAATIAAVRAVSATTGARGLPLLHAEPAVADSAMRAAFHVLSHLGPDTSVLLHIADDEHILLGRPHRPAALLIRRGHFRFILVLDTRVGGGRDGGLS
eukprot:scaffold238590_cov30-Tisochrysis_lutea.AAC.1